MFKTQGWSGVDSRLNGCAVNENGQPPRSRWCAMAMWIMGDQRAAKTEKATSNSAVPAPVAVIMSSLWRFVCHGHWPRSSPADRCHLPNWPPLTGDARCRPSGMAANSAPWHWRRRCSVSEMKHSICIQLSAKNFFINALMVFRFPSVLSEGKST